MAMDTTIYLDMALDRMRQEQLRHGMLLESICANQSKTNQALAKLLTLKNGAVYTQRESSQKTTSKGPLQIFASPDVMTGLKWLGGIIALVTVLKGGDAKTILEILSKVF